MSEALAKRGALAKRLDGPLFHPVTAFDGDGRLNLDVYSEYIRRRVDCGAAAVFACCDTGEFFSLDPDEYAACVRAAVEAAEGRVPVFAGVGYGTVRAIQFLARVEQSGVDGLLVLPPYLVSGGQAGLRRHYLALSESTKLDMILYQRDNVVFAPETVAFLSTRTNIVGLKDGVGNVDLLRSTMTAVLRSPESADFLFLNGAPRAEISALAYRELGITLHHSDAFGFAPDIAMIFYDALADGQEHLVRFLIEQFYLPFGDLRRLAPGYPTSLVKAVVRARGLDVGPVRPPLAEPASEHVAMALSLLDGVRDRLARR